MISLIVATDLNGAIGIKGDNRLPWHCSEDMKYFKEKTTGKVVIMGENTWFSLPDKFRPLPDRKSIVLTDDINRLFKDDKFIEDQSENRPLAASNIHYSYLLAESFMKKNEKYGNEIIVMGGYSIYMQFLELGLIDKIYINVLNLEVDRPEEDLLFFPFSPEEPHSNWVRQMKMETPEMTAYIFQRKTK